MWFSLLGEKKSMNAFAKQKHRKSAFGKAENNNNNQENKHAEVTLLSMNYQ